MKHIQLLQGNFVDMSCGETVPHLSGTLRGVANTRVRTLFVLESGDEVVILHLDRDQRPASRLLLLISGAIPYNIRTAVLTIRSEQGSEPGQSRLRLTVEGAAMQAPEVLPSLGARIQRNATLLDSINIALGTRAEMAAPDEESDDDDTVLTQEGSEGLDIPAEERLPIRFRHIAIVSPTERPAPRVEAVTVPDGPSRGVSHQGRMLTYGEFMTLLLSRTGTCPAGLDIHAYNRGVNAAAAAAWTVLTCTPAPEDASGEDDDEEA